ncbi:phenylacetate--CoA ligase family protein [Actinocatenispora rupis]|uniref:Coenzyme F390 synthetase n=1 Tax=Actinocatenispora rupis TaxID=519421 RepID=A0A8J3IWK2_9ACTN|nr:phenylacetate--CoA ligase family protein [Actinocatenispora rupis]GID09983.1 coenzyme F390 synthetase [Actinocatenispora rupis]
MSEDIRRFTREARRTARRDVREGPAAVERRQRERLADLVAYARERSPYHRELYRGLPERVADPTLLPVTDKAMLMAHFDDWVTDREVTRARVEEFVADPELVGARFLDRYLVATSSGTSGLRGLFVLDERNLAVPNALAARAGGALGARDLVRLVVRRGRTAVVTAPGGHFFTVAGTRRFQRDHPRLGGLMRVFPTDRPLPELVDALNRYDPASIAGFLSMLTQLAAEQEAGRLRVHPAILIPGGETSTAEVRQRLAAAFGARVRAAYAATECGFLSVGCPAGWYHVNSDWAVVEPVDADHRPVPPGTPSHTVLVSNLANRVQPFLRYDLGDSVVMRPDPCPCGNPMPALRVEGRAADVLTFSSRTGGRVGVSPMLFGTALDRVPGVHRFQLVQSAPDTLLVRLESGDGDVWPAVRDAIGRVLADRGADGVTLVRADEPPQQSPGGKYRRIVPLAART